MGLTGITELVEKLFPKNNLYFLQQNGILTRAIRLAESLIIVVSGLGENQVK